MHHNPEPPTDVPIIGHLPSSPARLRIPPRQDPERQLDRSRRDYLHGVAVRAASRVRAVDHAWVWASAACHVAEEANDDVELPDSRLVWLGCEMAWARDDLEEVGARECHLDQPLIDDPDQALDIIVPLLQRLTELWPEVHEGIQDRGIRDVLAHDDGLTALRDAASRAHACLSALGIQAVGRQGFPGAA